MIIVSDTSPITNLLLIDKLPLLESLFNNVIIPPAVHEEVLALHDLGNDITSYTMSKWINVIYPKNSMKISDLLITLDKGEAEAIVLAEELNAHYFLVDERLGTMEANKRNIKTIGLLGVLVLAKQNNLIKAVEPLLLSLKEQGFWISEKLIKRILSVVNEL